MDKLIECIDLLRQFCWKKALGRTDAELLKELDAVLATMPDLHSPRSGHAAGQASVVDDKSKAFAEGVSKLESSMGLAPTISPAPMTEAEYRAERERLIALLGDDEAAAHQAWKYSDGIAKRIAALDSRWQAQQKPRDTMPCRYCSKWGPCPDHAEKPAEPQKGAANDS